MSELWMYHYDYGHKYMFSTLGRIKRMPYYKNRHFTNKSFSRLYDSKILVGSKLSKKGYCRINIEGKTQQVHRLICEAFNGKSTGDKNQVNHINGNKTDNSIYNLEWCTNQENRDHAVENNLHPNRSNGFCIVKQSDIPDILARYYNGEIMRVIGYDYNVSQQTISKIIVKNRTVDMRVIKRKKKQMEYLVD